MTKRLRKHWPNTLIVWRGDSHYGRVEAMEWAEKNGAKRVVIPVGAPLKAALDARRPDKPEGTILRNTYGQPWTTDGFKTSWGKALDRAKLSDEDLNFHDLRGTAVTRLALAGGTVPEIAAITGHSIRDVEANRPS